MEPSRRNWWQPLANGRARKRLKQADRQPVATHGNRFGAHGRGVDSVSSLLSEVAHNWRAPLDFQVLTLESRLREPDTCAY
jgi:hypothetical protein